MLHLHMPISRFANLINLCGERKEVLCRQFWLLLLCSKLTTNTDKWSLLIAWTLYLPQHCYICISAKLCFCHISWQPAMGFLRLMFWKGGCTFLSLRVPGEQLSCLLNVLMFTILKASWNQYPNRQREFSLHPNIDMRLSCHYYHSSPTWMKT